MEFTLEIIFLSLAALVVFGYAFWPEWRRKSSGDSGVLLEKMEEKARLQTALYEALLEGQNKLGLGVIVLEGKHCVHVNEAFCAMTGYTVEECLQMSGLGETFAVPDWGNDESVEDGGVRASFFETKLAAKGGEAIEVEVAARSIPTGGGRRTLCVVRDNREQKRDRRALQESEERYKGLVEAAFDGIMVHADNEIKFASKAYSDIFGYAEGEMVGRSILDNIAPEYHNVIDARAESGEAVVYEVVGLKKDGSRLPVEISSKACRFAGQPARVSAVRDISGRKNAEETIRYQAYHDALTGLPNRLLLNDHLILELALASRHNHLLAVLLLDLDRLKNVNDILGHSVGDELIKGMAVRLKACLGEGDTLARLGGDEFAVLLPMIPRQEEAAKMAKRLLEAATPPFHLSGHEVHTTLSIGISLYPKDGTDVDGLLKNADAALYRAKENRNSFQAYVPAMNARALERLGLENRLRHAIDRNEFLLHYQPQVDLSTGKINGVEALIRWKHPDLGLVFPDGFISLAEETGLIVPIGEWVFREACRQSLAWRKAGLISPVMAINLSARQFEQRSLAATLTRVMKEEGVEPSQMELEITESLAMKDAEFTSRVLRVLKKLGLRVAMDDFGTGHSSLSNLKRFPLDTIKIDRSFIRELQDSPYDQAIVQAVIGVANHIQLRVVAEGVETNEQMIYLKERGCHSMQGYLFSRPVSADELADLLQPARTASRAASA
jgi:diguanylate cyclase (GGDEF)-like protein/PAS domain S-box-containing protein